MWFIYFYIHVFNGCVHFYIQLSLFKRRSSTKGNQASEKAEHPAESTSTGKLSALESSKIQQTVSIEPQTGDQTAATDRSRSAACILLWDLLSAPMSRIAGCKCCICGGHFLRNWSKGNFTKQLHILMISLVLMTLCLVLQSRYQEITREPYCFFLGPHWIILFSSYMYSLQNFSMKTNIKVFGSKVKSDVSSK